ncbi:uncharacterized protein C8Q71DRAFT_851196 [Rhodofomes roseus]|uniref:Uncharacterized protein n=1 Tax=Rhodofomes roseus TaxID=34475 RepID=A0ABQ8K2E7_9APHY|nr:uncharacterized protein C8Q71DRAFT_851196 [Rhodofomes roseus]KAH9830670.1 hypothetical protein C8Q71DRAFT_851196 [Rhodofomes roseus]
MPPSVTERSPGSIHPGMNMGQTCANGLLASSKINNPWNCLRYGALRWHGLSGSTGDFMLWRWHNSPYSMIPSGANAPAADCEVDRFVPKEFTDALDQLLRESWTCIPEETESHKSRIHPDRSGLPTRSPQLLDVSSVIATECLKPLSPECRAIEQTDIRPSHRVPWLHAILLITGAPVPPAPLCTVFSCGFGVGNREPKSTAASQQHDMSSITAAAMDDPVNNIENARCQIVDTDSIPDKLTGEDPGKEDVARGDEALLRLAPQLGSTGVEMVALEGRGKRGGLKRRRRED